MIGIGNWQPLATTQRIYRTSSSIRCEGESPVSPKSPKRGLDLGEVFHFPSSSKRINDLKFSFPGLGPSGIKHTFKLIHQVAMLYCCFIDEDQGIISTVPLNCGEFGNPHRRNSACRGETSERCSAPGPDFTTSEDARKQGAATIIEVTDPRKGPDGYRHKPDLPINQSLSITTSTRQYIHLIKYYTRPPLISNNQIPKEGKRFTFIDL